MARKPKLIIATGTKGVGKTHTTLEIINDYIIPKFLAGGELKRAARKVLIFDVNMEYTPDEIALKSESNVREGGQPFNFKALTLDIKDLAAYTKQHRVEVRRILPIDENGKLLGIEGMLKMLYIILETFRGGMLLLEDFNAYMVGTSSLEIISSITRNRHRDLDIYIHVQSLSPISPRMWQNCTEVRFHKQTDPVKRVLRKVSSETAFLIAETLVNMVYAYNNRFYVYVDNEYCKIRGDFDKGTYQLACYNFIQDNPRLISAAQQRFEKDVDKRDKAIKHCIRDYMKYYGNPN